MKWSGVLDDALLSRVEDACIEASAPLQQRWLDGWLVRTSPGKARRSRCIHAFEEGAEPLDAKLRQAAALYEAAGLTPVFRLTPFSRPADLDEQLAQRRFCRLDDTWVMVCTRLPTEVAMPPPAGLCWQPIAVEAFAEAVGSLRLSPASQRKAHADRLRTSSIPHTGGILSRAADGRVMACGQTARAADLVGLYDVYTAEDARGSGLASWLCTHLLVEAAAAGARFAYLQVQADNAPARRIYRRLGFVDGYGYHYREAPPPAG